jgi:hypothetical protein
MNGDVVVCEMLAGVWLEGTVERTPTGVTWYSLPRVGMPPPPPPSTREYAGTTKEARSLDGPLMLFSSRQRKRPELYDASTTSTEYTRSLRKKEGDDEALRRISRIVTFVDGIRRCVRFDREGHGVTWVRPHEWSAKSGELRSAIPPPSQPLACGRVILMRVDGKGWRRVRLERRVNKREWRHIRAERLGVSPVLNASSSSSSAAAATSTSSSFAEASGGRCKVPPETLPCGGGIPPPCHAECSNERGASRSGRIAAPVVRFQAGSCTNDSRQKRAGLKRETSQEQKSRAGWWRVDVLSAALRRRRRLIVELAEETRLLLWQVPDDLSCCEGVLAEDGEHFEEEEEAEMEDDDMGDEDEDEDEDSDEGNDESDEGADGAGGSSGGAVSRKGAVKGRGSTRPAIPPVGPTTLAALPLLSTGPTAAKPAAAEKQPVASGLDDLSRSAALRVIERAREIRLGMQNVEEVVHGWRLRWTLSNSRQGAGDLFCSHPMVARGHRSIAALERHFFGEPGSGGTSTDGSSGSSQDKLASVDQSGGDAGWGGKRAHDDAAKYGGVQPESKLRKRGYL